MDTRSAIDRAREDLRAARATLTKLRRIEISASVDPDTLQPWEDSALGGALFHYAEKCADLEWMLASPEERAEQMHRLSQLQDRFSDPPF